MSDYDKNKLRRLDLTVLLVFLGLIRTRKAADVAGELGLTSSSISHALKRLRDVFGDELFLRRPHGLEPTAYALRIEPDVRRAVDAVQSALTDQAKFDPATATGLLCIAASDREVASLIPSAFADISREAANLRLSVRSLSKAESLRGLSDGSLDFAIGYFNHLGPDYDAQPIRTETYLVAARHGHPIFDADLTLETYTAASHVLVSGDGSLSGIVDGTLARLGLERRVCLALPAFLPALVILSNSDFIATLPADLVRQHAATFGLTYRQPPLTIRPFQVSILSHRRNQKSALHLWCLRKILAASSRDRDRSSGPPMAPRRD